MRATNQHIYPLGIDLVAANERQKPSLVNPELVILRRKAAEWREAKTGLSFEEYLLTDKI